MANRERGEVELTLAGKKLTLKMGSGALIAAQEAVSTPDRFVSIEQLFEQAARGRVLYVRVLIWAALQKFHRGMSMADVEELLDGASEAEVADLLRAMGGTTVPDPRDVKELDLQADGPRPQEAQAATTAGTGGETSTSTPDAQA